MKNQQKTYCVYTHTNLTNGKVYVGMTSLKPEKRWGFEGSNYFHQPFWDAIEEFGWNGFKHEILATGLTEEAAKAMETQLIAEFKTTDPKYGYNIQRGCRLKADSISD